jgi:hypothetical protein
MVSEYLNLLNIPREIKEKVRKYVKNMDREN